MGTLLASNEEGVCAPHPWNAMLADLQAESGVSPDDREGRLREARARIGATLRGKWHLETLLGLGGMGAVYEATHRNGMRGALKILDRRLGHSGAARERFLREGLLANEVGHAGAVSVLDDDETEDGCAFLVMELLAGATLEEVAERSGGALPMAQVTRCGMQVLKASPSWPEAELDVRNGPWCSFSLGQRSQRG